VAEKTSKPTKVVEKSKQPNRITRWWRETVGELRKVSWPTTEDAWRLTKIVLIVMAVMSLFLGLLDFVFASLIRLVLG